MQFGRKDELIRVVNGAITRRWRNDVPTSDDVGTSLRQRRVLAVILQGVPINQCIEFIHEKVQITHSG